MGFVEVRDNSSSLIWHVIRLTFIACLVASQACHESKPPETSAYELAGGQADRATQMSSIIAKHKAPPTHIDDAHFLEEQIGNGVVGPSDFRAFYAIDIAPEDAGLWIELLTPLSPGCRNTAHQHDQPIGG
jgi:hypothetical protein